MQSFHSLVVQDIRRETPDCVSVALTVPPTLRETFAFIPGQYLTFKHEINGEEIRRSYSICSAPNERELRVAIKQVPNGKFSTFANTELKEGDEIQSMPPQGNFKHLSIGQKNGHYVAFAAGSGITPIMSILKSSLYAEPDCHFTLFYGNRTMDDVIFKEELEALKNVHLNRLSIFYFFTREYLDTPLFNGRIDQEKTVKLAKLLFANESPSKFYLCGPEEMIWSAKDGLIQCGYPEDDIKFELFTTSESQSQEVFRGNLVEEQMDNHSTVEVVLDGKRFAFDLAFAGESVLDAALKEGADLPYACKGGVCCTCKAKLLEGEVEMQLNYGLEPDEVENNFILTCQSHPRTDKIVVDFDV